GPDRAAVEHEERRSDLGDGTDRKRRDLAGGEPVALDIGAVAAAEVLDVDRVADPQAGVAARDRAVLDVDVDIVAASQDDLTAGSDRAPDDAERAADDQDPVVLAEPIPRRCNHVPRIYHGGAGSVILSCEERAAGVLSCGSARSR